MSRNAGWVEAVAVGAGLLGLTGCISSWPDPDPVPIFEIAEAPRPDGLDYIRAVQCGGLMWALQASSYRTHDSGPLSSVTGMYRRWAEALATESGKDPAFALRDMAASRDDLLRSTGGDISPAAKANALSAAYRGDMKACRTAAEAADYGTIVIGG